MSKPNRKPIQLSQTFHEWLKNIQKEIMLARGEHKSFNDISEEMLKSPLIKDLETNLIRKKNAGMNIKVKLDRRFFE